MHIETYDQLSEQVATLVAQQIATEPDCCLGLPTGQTPIGTYKLLSTWSREGRLNWSKVRCFALDDYLDVPPALSFHTFLSEHLYQHTNIDAGNIFHPGMTDNYDALIEGQGGLDMTVLGIGGNGHIAFNEPGTQFLSWTHCTWLEDSTRKANQASFGTSRPPQKAVTMGVKTILSSRRIVLMASGEKKKAIVEAAFRGPVSRQVPASYLQAHEGLEVLTDFGFSLTR